MVSVAISLTIGLVSTQYSHGQNVPSENEKTLATLQESLKEKQTLGKSLDALLNYCFQHADRPNPLQDLIDKGFLPETFKGQTCISVRDNQTKNNVERTIINEKINNLTSQVQREGQEGASRYAECLQNKSTTFEECYRIIK